MKFWRTRKAIPVSQPGKLAARRKRNSLSFRVRDQLKERLQKAAETSGRSVSEEIEFRLNRDFYHEETKRDLDQLKEDFEAKTAELEHKLAVIAQATKVSIEELQRVVSLSLAQRVGKQ